MTPPLLLDVNVLLALGWVEHEAHQVVVERLSRPVDWATCAITQLGFIRISATNGIFSHTPSPAQAQAALAALCADKRHRYAAEHPSVVDCDFSRLAGPRQTTDAYLLALARRHHMQLLTLDRRLANTFEGDPVELLQT